MDAARVLFERLYRHDQVAFDASGTAVTADSLPLSVS